MHKEILTEEQIKLLPLVKKFTRTFGLVGGTAIALQIGHRRSIDFDMFSSKEFINSRIRRAKKIFEGNFNERIFREVLGYFNDVSYDEEVEYLPGFEVSDEVIKKALIEFSLEK